MFANKILYQYIILSIGSLILALGVVLFFLGNDITTGGSPGMAMLLYHMTGFSVGSMFLALNVVLLLLGYRYMGRSFAVRTTISIAMTSFFIDFLTKTMPIHSLTDEIFLATLFGGVMIGVGVGLILRADASAGGSTIIARIISANSEIKPSEVIMTLDFFIIIISIYLFIDIERAMWSVFSIYVTAITIDVVLSGRPSKKIVHLVTNNSELLSQKIIQDLGCHGTVIHGTGLRVEQDKSIIFIIVELSKLRVLRELIAQNDPDAFMVVMDASELLGRGHGA